MFAPKISDFWAENTYFLHPHFQERVGWKTKSINISCSDGPIVTKIFHIAIMSLPTYHAKNIDIDSPFVCFLVHMHSFRYHLWQKFPVSAGYSEMPIAILSSRLRKVKRIVVRGHT